MYFVFDMDETIAELYSVYYFIASLRLPETIKENNRHLPNISEEMQDQLKKAYQHFLKLILVEEASEHPLGILRPGILNVMTELNILKINGLLKNVLIYSNNSHLESLEFIRDLIHEYIGEHDLIRDCIHWNHPLRGREKIIHPGFSTKTWTVLKNIMISGNCQVPPSIEPKDVHFFDDLDHYDLKVALKDNYHRVPPYTFRASFKRISDIYRKVIQDSNIDVNEYMDYIIPIFANSKDIITFDHPLDMILDLFSSKTEGTASVYNDPPFWNPPNWDQGVNTMLEVIAKFRSKSEDKGRLRGPRVDESDGGTRRRRKHYRRRSSKKNRKRKRAH